MYCTPADRSLFLSFVVRDFDCSVGHYPQAIWVFAYEPFISYVHVSYASWKPMLPMGSNEPMMGDIIGDTLAATYVSGKGHPYLISQM